jgi:F-type H+-transporting ATPase subunit delta
MADVNEKAVGIARVYSRALFEVASAQGKTEEVLEELSWLAGQARSKADFADFLSSPMIDGALRAKSLDAMFRGKLSNVVVDGLQVINRKGRLSLLVAIAELYRRELRDSERRVDVFVRTAQALTPALEAEIAAAMARFTGRKPELHIEVDASLLGGVVLQVEDKKVDASVINEIRRYRRLLEDRAASEIFRSREQAHADVA